MDGKTQYNKDIYFPRSNQEFLRAIVKSKQQSLCVGEGRYFSAYQVTYGTKRQIVMEYNRDPRNRSFSVLMYNRGEIINP